MEIQLDGPGQYEKYREDDTVLYMAKQGPILDEYMDLAERLRPKNILELGVFRGGSAVFFHRLFTPDRLVGIEREDRPPPRLQAYMETEGADVMKVYYGVDQGDAAAVDRIVRENFPHGIDLVVDDASHWYEPTKASFEAVFPYLRPGGLFALEDWDWAQTPGMQEPGALWSDRAALTNLLLEIVIAHGHPAALFEEVVFRRSVVYVRRGRGAVTPGEFRLDDFLLTRGKPLAKL